MSEHNTLQLCDPVILFGRFLEQFSQTALSNVYEYHQDHSRSVIIE